MVHLECMVTTKVLSHLYYPPIDISPMHSHSSFTHISSPINYKFSQLLLIPKSSLQKEKQLINFSPFANI